MCFVPRLLKYLLDAPVNRRVNGARGWGDPLYFLALHRLLSSIRPKNDGVKLEWISSSTPRSDDTQKLVFAFCTRPTASSSSFPLSCQFCCVTIFVDETFSVFNWSFAFCVVFVVWWRAWCIVFGDFVSCLLCFSFFCCFFFFSSILGSKFPCESFRVKT